MKAHVYRRNGEPTEVLGFEDIAAPAQLGPNEVVVRVTRRMVHPIDDVMIRGYIPAPIPAEGTVPGGDGVGVVEQVGSDVDAASGIKPGQRVMLFPAQGTWAERVVAPAMAIIPVPDDVSDTTACQIAINGITAIVLMRATLAASGGSPLLITAAGSGVGRNLIALAQMRGAKAVALVRSDAGAAILAPSVPGVSVVSSEHEGWAAKVTAAAGQAPTVAIDPIGGEMSPQLLNLLADGGTLLTYGGLDARPSAVSTISLTVRQQTLRGLNAYSWLASTPAQRASDITDLFEMARRAPQNFAEYSEFAFDQATEALAATHATPRRGATILTSET
ncbi:zinc-binding dehydrogenase [Burkholderia cenocepacia]|uniref:zinc-binding dehydrogenase n=1 Tax=Burkholderia cenocepacia TaxID=95486 RepID=UPI002854B412|nr:zinc-binding dehydrogenase [Burkholderia cenocepacia]MDR8048036.1 zinc-binding dehydrogenase [Burkholderia cenocepacia]